MSYSNTGPHHRDDQVQNAPFLNLTAPTVPQGSGGRLGSLDNPWSALPAGNPFPAAFGTFSPFADYTALPYHLPSPYLITWNLSVQRQIGTNWLVSASYIGSHTTHLWTLQPTNYAVLVPNTAGTPLGTCPAGVTAGCNSLSNTNQRRILNLANPKAQIGNMVQIDPSGTGSYNGMLLSAQHRFSRSFSVQTNYTWSHCISDFDPNPTMQGGAGEGTWTDPHNRRFDRGACNADRRNVFNLTGVAQVPKFSSRPLRMIASGWQIAPIFRRQTGQPLNIIEGSDRALEGIQDFLKGVQFQRANCLSGVDPYGSTSGNTLYLNPAAFSQPALGHARKLRLQQSACSHLLCIRYGSLQNFSDPRAPAHRDSGRGIQCHQHLSPRTVQRCHQLLLVPGDPVVQRPVHVKQRLHHPRWR